MYCRHALCGAEPRLPLPSLLLPPALRPFGLPLPCASIPGFLVLLCSGPHGAQRAVATESAGGPQTSDLGEGERGVCERETESWSRSELGRPGLSSSCLSVCLSCIITFPPPPAACVSLESLSPAVSHLLRLLCLSLCLFCLSASSQALPGFMFFSVVGSRSPSLRPSVL